MLSDSSFFNPGTSAILSSWTEGDSYLGQPTIELISGEWQGKTWHHRIVVVGMEHASDACLLYITGGDPNQHDIREAEAMSRRSCAPVAILFGIPNQPLFDDRWEDDLIAFTFDKFLETGDPSWPILRPMVRAATSALDALVDQFKFCKFVITGLSKRGWTTWLVGLTGDPRIVGIAPMVFDALSFPAQMQHQLDSWGEYSEQISDYTNRSLPQQSTVGRGVELVSLVDPFSYLAHLTCPVLVVNGSNDRYWTVDALSLYWASIPGEKSCLIVPNTGHMLGDRRQMIESVGEFARRRFANCQMPSVEFQTSFDGTRVSYTLLASEPATYTLWMSEADSRDFRDSTWRPAKPSSFTLSESFVAVVPEFRFSEGFSLSLPARIFSK